MRKYPELYSDEHLLNCLDYVIDKEQEKCCERPDRWCMPGQCPYCFDITTDGEVSHECVLDIMGECYRRVANKMGMGVDDELV